MSLEYYRIEGFAATIWTNRREKKMLRLKFLLQWNVTVIELILLQEFQHLLDLRMFHFEVGMFISCRSSKISPEDRSRCRSALVVNNNLSNIYIILVSTSVIAQLLEEEHSKKLQITSRSGPFSDASNTT